ncbi:MAG: homogentisate 1,2-dioxygenase [Polyangia bacterium]
MLDRICLGTVPAKPHTVLRDEAGKLLYEHCLTRQGFDGGYSILYHRSLPPRDVAHRSTHLPGDPELYFDECLRRRHLLGPRLSAEARPDRAPGQAAGQVSDRSAPLGDHLGTRRVLMANSDVAIGLCRALRAEPRYFANGDGDELYFVQEGAGRIESLFGVLAYKPGDYLLIPRGTIYRMVPDAGPDGTASSLLLFIEGRTYLEIPQNFRNGHGMLRMDAPYSHRDFRRPTELCKKSGPDFSDGRYSILVKRGGTFHEIVRDCDPLDVVGWDGSVYPLALSIHDYNPKVGRVHLPPTAFTTFVGGGFVVCSFVPRLCDFDANAIPCPYPHSSVDCDEVIFYVSGNFTSRRGIGPGSLSLHPAGIPHGPQPGAYEASIGKTRTDELAVMIDTFKPLGVTAEARTIDDPNYHDSWHR